MSTSDSTSVGGSADDSEGVHVQRYLPVLILILLCGSCAAVRQQKALPQVSDAADHRNLEVLPPNITREQLLATMRTFTKALNVGCDHCHVSTTEGEERTFDFASDAKSEKEVARVMMLMTRSINEDHVSRVNVYGAQVTCMTCHRGRTIPTDEPQEPAEGR